MNKSERIWEYIDTFRKSSYFQEVIGQGYVARWAGIHIGASLEQEDEEFVENLREMLINSTILAPEAVEPFLENNSIEALRDAFAQFLNEDIEPIGFIDKFLELKDCGLFIASHMLSHATNGAYIIYHQTLYDGLMELFPILEENLEPATNGVTFMYVQMACDVILQTFQFTSLQELHEFLWHGKETDWKFTEE